MKCHNCGFESKFEMCPLCGIKQEDPTSVAALEHAKKAKKASNRKTLLIILLCLSPIIVYVIIVLIAMVIGYFDMLETLKHMPAPNEDSQVLFDNNVHKKDEVIDLEWGTLKFTGIEPAPLDASFDQLYNCNIYEINLQLTNTSDTIYTISFDNIEITDNDNIVIIDNTDYKYTSKGITPGETHEIKAVAIICQPENELEFTYKFNCLSGDTVKYSYKFSYTISQSITEV